MWTLWGNNGEPMLTHENGGDVVGSVVNLLWHDLELVIMSNEVTPLPDRETGWQYQESVRSTFLKNIKYIISHREQWRIIVHVRSTRLSAPNVLSYTDTVFAVLLVCQVNDIHYEPILETPLPDHGMSDNIIAWLVGLVNNSKHDVHIEEEYLLKKYEGNPLVVQILKAGGRLNNKYKEALVADAGRSSSMPYTRGMDARESLSVVPSSSPPVEQEAGGPEGGAERAVRQAAVGTAAAESAPAALAAAVPAGVMAVEMEPEVVAGGLEGGAEPAVTQAVVGTAAAESAPAALAAAKKEPERTRRTRRGGGEEEEEKEKDPAVLRQDAGSSSGAASSGARRSIWQTEKRRILLSRMTWSKVCSALETEELERCFDYHYDKFLDTHPKAKGAGRPSNDQAKRNWLREQVKAGDKNLVPYIKSIHDAVRSRFCLPTYEEVVLARNQLTFAKMPSVRQMWVENPEKSPFGWSKSNKQVEGVPWK